MTIAVAAIAIGTTRIKWVTMTGVMGGTTGGAGVTVGTADTGITTTTAKHNTGIKNAAVPASRHFCLSSTFTRVDPRPNSGLPEDLIAYAHIKVAISKRSARAIAYFGGFHRA